LRAEPEVVVGDGLAWCEFAVAGDPLRRSPAGVRERLRALGERWSGGEASELRRRSIPQAYLQLARRLGIDPDERRIPVERYVVERLVHGGFRSRGLLADALLVAAVETAVGVWALDADRIGGPLRRDGGEIVAGERVVGPAFAEPAAAFAVTAATRRVLLYAVLAPAVPLAAVDEALWTAWSIVLVL
jgi:DNA/RNA-binding domain of Phe-tRNA-synthetase-like protein